MPVHRRQERPGLPPGRGAQPAGGRRRRHPADLCRADAGAVAGGGVVGADPRRAQRRSVPAAARASTPATPRCPTGASPKISDDDAWAVFKRLGVGGRPGGRGVGGRHRTDRCRAELPLEHLRCPPLPPRRSTPRWRRTSYSALDPRRRRRRCHQRAGGQRERDDETEVVAVDRKLRWWARTCARRWPTCRAARRSARWCTRCWRPPTRRPPTSPASSTSRCAAQLAWWPVDVDAGGAGRRRWCRCMTRRWARWPSGLTLRQIGLRDRLRELDFEIPLAGGDHRAVPSRTCRLSDVGELLRAHLPADDPLAPYADRLTSRRWAGSRCAAICRARSTSVLRLPDAALSGGRLQDQLAGRHRGRLQPRLGWPRRCCTPTIRCRRCCTPLCCTGFCAGGCPATTLRGISAGCCICSCAACAGRDARWSTGSRAGCSAGSRRRAGGRAVGSARRGTAGGMTVADVELAVGASGLAADVQRGWRARRRRCACRPADLTALGKEPDEPVALAVALAVRGAARRIGVRRPATVAADAVGAEELPWPEPAAGWRRCAASLAR